MQEFIIDKLTNSIEERITGRNYETDIVLIGNDEIKKVHKKDGWFFNWKKEFKERHRLVYKLTLTGGHRIQGLLSLEPVSYHSYIELHLIENAPHNYGERKEFIGVTGNLVAFACKMSFDLGYGGFVAFTAKTELVDHYAETLGARVIYSSNRMGIFTPDARKLVNLYYKNHADSE